MRTLTRKPKTKPARRVKLLGGIMLLTVGKSTTGYYVSRLASDFGTAYRVEKFADANGVREVYDVNLNGRETSCTCKGGCYVGRCKHAEALTALVNAGKL